MNQAVKYLPDENDLRTVANSKATGPGAVLLKAAERMRDEYRSKNEKSPKISDDPITEDFRFIAGMTKAMNELLALPDRAQGYFNKKDKKE